MEQWEVEAENFRRYWNSQLALRQREIDQDPATIRHRRLKEQVLLHYGRRCETCGSEDFKRLCLHHLNEDGPEHRNQIRKTHGGEIYAWLLKHNLPEGYLVLCQSCHCRYHARLRQKSREKIHDTVDFT